MARLLIVEDNQELASLIASAACARGHQARAVHTGQGAFHAVAEGELDLAVVDLLLPDIQGGEVLALLAERTIPAIAMSGVFKGHRFAQEAVSRHGARAFFEKPFELAALLTEIERVAGPAAPVEPAGPSDLLEELHGLEPIDIEVDPPPQPKGAQPWERAFQRPRGPARARAPDLPASGSLAETSVPKLLTAYFQARHEGELVLRREPIVKVIYFEGGRPVYAASNLARERFARFCVRKGLLRESDLEAVALLAAESGLRTGEAMVQLGLIRAEDRRPLLEEQVKEILWSTFGWTEGRYAFSPKLLARADLERLSVFPGTLILEGVRHTETLVSLRGKLPPKRRLFPTPDPPYALSDFVLTGPQALLLAHSDGSKTVEDLLTLVDLPEREALATLLGFELMGILEERRHEGRERRISFGL